MAQKVVVVFEAEKVTKNTVRFQEVLDSELAQPKVGTLYVQKSTLAELGFKEGDRLQLTVEVAQ